MNDGLGIFELFGIFIFVTIVGFIGNAIFLFVYNYFHPIVWDYPLILGYAVLEAIFAFSVAAVGK